MRLFRRGRWKTFDLPAPEFAEPVRIVADGMIMTRDVGDGRLLPAIMFDAAQRPDLMDVLRAHRDVSPESGDVESAWGSATRADCIVDLVLEFQVPVHTISIFRFDIKEQGGVVDHIIGCEGFYLFGGIQGDKVTQQLLHGEPHILVEVRADFRNWDWLLKRCLQRDARTRGVKDKKDQEAYAAAVVEEWRTISSHRFPRT